MKACSYSDFFHACFVNVRSVLLWCSLIISFLLITPPLVLLLLVIPYQYLSSLIRLHSWLLCLSAGVWCDYNRGDGCQSKNGVMFLCNHQSMFDQCIMRPFWQRPMVAIYEEKYLRRFFIGYFLRRAGGVPISRVDHDSAMRTLNNIKAVFAAGVSIAICPEGTRSYGGKLLPFKSGAFHLAKQTGVKIVAVVMDKAYQAKTKGNWRLCPKRVKVRHAVTVTQDEYQDWTVEQLRDYVRHKMQARLDSLNA